MGIRGNDLKKYSDLKSVEGHKNFYRSEKSGIIYYKDSLLGKFSTKETTIQRAKNAVNIRRQQVLNGKDLLSAKRSVFKITNPPISEIWKEFVLSKTDVLSSGTIETYNTSWKILKDFFGEKNTAQLNEKNLIEFKSWYIKNHSERLVERTVIHLKGLIKYCFEKRIIREIPKLKTLNDLIEVVDVKSHRAVHERVYTQSEVKLLLQNALVCTKHEYINVRTYLAILLGANCGMRKHEILNLKWTDIDLKDRQLDILSHKTHTRRQFPITNTLEEAFKLQKSIIKNESDFVFPRPSNPKKNISSQIFDKHWIIVKNMSNITGVAKFHDLRRTCVTRLLESGFSSDQVSKLLGHSVKEIHDTYYKLTKKFRDETLEKLEKLTINKESLK